MTTDTPRIVLQPLGEAGEACEGDVCAVPPRVVGGAESRAGRVE